MKLKSNPKNFSGFMAFCFCASIIIIPAANSNGNPLKDPKTTKEEPKEPLKKGRTKLKSNASLKNNFVKIYPDIFKRDMHVVAKDLEEQEIEFFVFDVEGTLIQNQKMKGKDHIRISGLARGTYRYHVFLGDMERAGGSFEIR